MTKEEIFYNVDDVYYKHYEYNGGAMYLSDESIAKIKSEIEAYANKRVIEELEKQMELAQIGNSYTRLRERIKELKQD